MKRHPRAIELQRFEAFTKTSDDDAAAQLLGIRKVTFVAWRNREHLPCKRLPGQRKHITFQQERLLEYLAANPWSKLYTISKSLGVHSWTAMERLHRLEGKDLVKISIVGRVRVYALKAAEPLKGMTSLDAGAPGFYHTNLRGRIEELLRKEPWLPMCLIQKRLQSYGTPKSIEAALLSMASCGRLQRQVIETPKRRMYVYAAPGRRLSKTRQRKMWKEIGSTTSFWKTNDKILKALRLRPWQTATDLAKAEGIDRSYVYNALTALIKRGLIRRVRVKVEQVGRARPADYVYGLMKNKDPKCLTILEGESSPRSSLVIIATVMQKLQHASPGAILAACAVRNHRHLSLAYLKKRLELLEHLGIVSYASMGRYAGQYEYVGKVDILIMQEAEAHWSSLQKSASKLRRIGYQVDLELHMPRPEVIPVVHVEDVGVPTDTERVLEVVAK